MRALPIKRYSSSIKHQTPSISIVIVLEKFNPYLSECLEHLEKLDYPNFEVLVFPTKGFRYKSPHVKVIPNPNLAGRPAEKRDLALKYAKGEILAFIDDDAYPARDWLKNAMKYFSDPKIAAVCGPGVTPPSDSLLQKASGLIQSSFLGGGGGGFAYRFVPKPKREVDDYPSMNFLVRKSDFSSIGGFDSHYWPGEDTKLCLDLTYKLGKKIIYDPKVLVFHHCRPLFIPHLKQIGRYGLHRGHFARVLPKTSFRLTYFIPSLFTLFFFLTPLVALISKFWFSPLRFWFTAIYYILNTIYFILLLLTAIWIYSKERDLKVALLVIPGIFLTHIFYGLRFIQGFLSPKLRR